MFVGLGVLGVVGVLNAEEVGVGSVDVPVIVDESWVVGVMGMVVLGIVNGGTIVGVGADDSKKLINENIDREIKQKSSCMLSSGEGDIGYLISWKYEVLEK